MANPVFVTGTKGSITIPTAAGGITAAFDQWTFSMPRALLELPATFDDEFNWIEQVGLRAKGVGSGRAHYSAAGIPVIGTLATQDAQPTAGFILLAEDGASTDGSYAFAGFITDINHTCEVLTTQIITISFESSGAVTPIQPTGA